MARALMQEISLELTQLNRQDATPAPVGGAGEFAKRIIRIAKKPWRHRKNLGVLSRRTPGRCVTWRLGKVQPRNSCYY